MLVTMTAHCFWLVGILAATFAACGGRVMSEDLNAGGNGGGGTSSGGFAGASTGGSAGADAAPWDAAIDGAQPTPQQLCEMQETMIGDPCTTQEMRDRVVHRWWQCSGQFVFNPQDGVGIEFMADGTWAVLKLDPQGGIIQGTGFAYQGTWDVFDTSSMNGPCKFQLDINSTGGGVGGFPKFSKEPAKMYMNTGGDGPAPTWAAIP